MLASATARGDVFRADHRYFVRLIRVIRIRQAPTGSVARLERIAQHRQALRELTTLDQQLPFQELARGLPKMCIQSCRHVDQTRDLSFGGREVANHGGDTAYAVIQGPAKQELVIRTAQFFQAGVSFTQRSFREALHPKRASQHRPGRRVVI